MASRRLNITDFFPPIARTTLDFFGFMPMPGMREEYRKARVDRDKCNDPGPHQQGFEEVPFT